MNKELTIGLFGYGSAGRGFHEILQHITTPFAHVKTIVVRNQTKNRELTMPLHSFNSVDIINDCEIDTVVELIDDSIKAWEIVKSAIEAGKNIVTGNKKMIAENFQELLFLQEKYNVAVLYDASVCASIPIIRAIEEYYEKDLLVGVSGILNGSSNYILTKICNECTTYADALLEAQNLGFAESNPYFDVAGWDTLYKLVVLTGHSFRLITDPKTIFRLGISSIDHADVEFAKVEGLNIRLVANSVKISEQQLAVYVIPTFVPSTHPLFNVDYEYNAVVVEGFGYEKQVMIGKGAGASPTGSAVLSDVAALYRKYRYRLNSGENVAGLRKSDTLLITIYVRTTLVDDLKIFEFETVDKTSNDNENVIVVGRIWLKKLKLIQHEIESRNIFVAEIVN